MDPATAHMGDIVTVQRSKKVYGAGRDKLVYSYVEATQLSRRGVIERVFPRFAVVRMFANLQDAKENGQPLYRECFYWPELSGMNQENKGGKNNGKSSNDAFRHESVCGGQR